MTSSHTSDLPAHYAREYLPRAELLLRGALGDQVRRMLPAIVPGLPIESVIAFCAPGYQGSDTVDGTSSAAAEVAFHEIGYFQVPAGPREGPAPNPDPGAPDNTWGRLAGDRDVVRVLGRAATMSPGAWRDALADQVAVGMAMLRDNYHAAVRRIPAGVEATGWSTQWGVATMFTAFSAGPAAAALATRYAEQLHGVPEAGRFGALVHAVALEVQAGADMGGAPDRHSNIAHRVLRTWQKLELARQLAAAAGGNAAFFELGLDTPDVHAELIVRGNWKLPPGPLQVQVPSYARIGASGERKHPARVLVGVLLLGGALGLALRANQR